MEIEQGALHAGNSSSPLVSAMPKVAKSPTSAEQSVGLRMMGAEGDYRLVCRLAMLVVSVLDA